ncbi:MAG TPA: hypothetical protein VFT29_08680 [Gemmatimonadaceae bacterium]|nr:hypothetical protein [Gemmatimonadaceae bacterium]
MRPTGVARLTTVGAILLIAQASACNGESVAGATAAIPETFTVFNNLIAPVTISLDGKPYLWVDAGGSTSFSMPSTTQRLTWVSAKPLDAHGTPIFDDIGSVTISLGASSHQLNITNVINSQAYITARVYNTTAAAVSIGVFNGSEVSCASELPARRLTEPGFTLIGYYKLLIGTEIRAYREPSGCTGPYIAWPASQIRAFTAKSGLLTLTLDTAP